jgi:hypothetical protein
MRGVVLALLPAMLGLMIGCASAPGGGGNSKVAVARDVRVRCDALIADPRIDPVRSKIQLPLSFDAPQPVDRLSDRTFPTADERAAVQALWEARAACRRYGEEKLGPMPNYRAESEEALVDLLGDLRDGAITYGQFARMFLHVGARDKHARELLDEAQRARDTASVD